MTQKQTIKMIKSVLKSMEIQWRMIKIHGGKYQETGLPDLLMLLRRGNQKRTVWIELKSSWTDSPTSLQRFNVESLRQFGIFTGYVVGDKYKADWADRTPVNLIVWLEEILANR